MKVQTVILAVAAVAVLAFTLWHYSREERGEGAGTSAGESVSDGTLSFTLAPNFGLATTTDEVPHDSYIPPCDENFTYCLYYKGEDYEGTNFESAGIRISTLATTTAGCAAAPYDGLKKSTREGADYTLTTFGPLGNGAAGHYATGELYRLAYKGACYELETRIGETQFANYPLGAILKFTDDEKAELLAKMNAALARITLPGGEPIFSGQ